MNLDAFRDFLLNIHECEPNEQRSMIEAIKNCGFDINQQDDEGETMLSSASSSYEDLGDIVSCLLRNGADETIKHRDGEDVLHRVVYWQNNVCLIELLKNRDFATEKLEFYQNECRRGGKWPAGDAIISQYI